MLQNSYTMSKKEKHHFHLVDNSSLPLLTSFSTFLLVCSFVFWFHPLDSTSWNYLDNILFQLAWMSFLLILLMWFVTVLIEADVGYHTLIVRTGLRYGMALFIISEVLFFFAFFWAFFHVSLSPSVAMGCVWPPKSVQALDIWALPLTNTLLLLSSGFATTMAHKSLWDNQTEKSMMSFKIYLALAILLGFIFLVCQTLEYKYGITFSWKENIYGSTFFVTTGFHGFHVTMGTLFLMFCWLRVTANIFENIQHYFLAFKNKALSLSTNNNAMLTPVTVTKEQHMGFEAAAWYWHFVDVVWMFLFLTVYWWGSY